MTSPQHSTRLWSQLAFGEPRYWFLFIAYILLTLLVALHHEPWRDEAQAWLVARDNGIPEILRLEQYEVIPGLWHLLLYVPAHLGMPYGTMQLLHWALNGLAVYIILRWVRVDFKLMVGMVFSYFIFYEYAVVARNYVLALLGLAVLAAAWFRPWSAGKYWVYLGFFLTAASSLFGLWLAVPVAVALLLKICGQQGWRRAIVPMACFAAIGILCFLPMSPGVIARFQAKPAAGKQLGSAGAAENGRHASAVAPARGSAKPTGVDKPIVTKLPPGSAAFPAKRVPAKSSASKPVRSRPAPSLFSKHSFEVAAMAFYVAFSQGGFEELLYLGNLPTFVPQLQMALGVAFFTFALLFLSRAPRYLALFLGMSAGVLAIILIVPLTPTHFRHSGSIFLAFLFCWWLMENDAEPHRGWPERLRFVAPRVRQWGKNILGAAIALIWSVQVFAAAVAAYPDYGHPFSQGRNTAQYLKAEGLLPNDRYYWVSYQNDAVTSVLAYFDDIKMYNLIREQPESYIVWDRQYHESQGLTNAEASSRLARVARDHPDKAIMILANQRLGLSLEPPHSLQLLKSFEPALKGDESFYIYRYR